MSSLSTDSLRWAQREKGRHLALIGLAVLASALIAAAPHNERRMFTLPELPAAFAAIPEPEPTSLRSAVMGYLHDGCSPIFRNASGDLTQLVNRADCGPARERTSRDRKSGSSPFLQQPGLPTEPAAYFADPQGLPFGPDMNPLVIAQPLLAATPVGFTSPAAPGGGGGFIPGIPIPLPGGGGGGGSEPPPTPPIPEPATWALMIGGFALTGAMMRRRRTMVRFAAA